VTSGFDMRDWVVFVAHLVVGETLIAA
jgi:hypothetical protein